MKKFFEENKNIIFVSTYIIAVLAIILNYKTVIGFILFILSVLQPLFYAIAMAFVLNIPMRFIEKTITKMAKGNKTVEKMKRTISVLLTLVFAAIILFLLVIIIIPKVSESIVEVFKSFNVLVDSSIQSINKIFIDLGMDFRIQDISFIKELQKLSGQQIFENAINIFGGFTQGVISNALAFTNAFFQWFLAFCLSLYLLSGKEKLICQLKQILYAIFSTKAVKRILDIGQRANYVFTKFVGGQLVDCAIKGIMFYIVFLILGYPLPELLATIITVCSIVPVFGPIFAMVIDFILLFAFDPIQAVWFIVIFQVLSNLESQIIYPKIVGKSIGLPGIWVLLSIFILGDLFGIAGMLLAVPVTALVYDLFGEFVKKRLKKKDIKVSELPQGE